MPNDALTAYRRLRRAALSGGAAMLFAFNGLIALQSWRDYVAALQKAQQSADHLARAAELHVSRRQIGQERRHSVSLSVPQRSLERSVGTIVSGC